MALVQVGEVYQLKHYKGRVQITGIMEASGVLGIMACTLDDIMIPDPHGQYSPAYVRKDAIVALTIIDLILDGDNADFEHLLPSMDEVM